MSEAAKTDTNDWCFACGKDNPIGLKLKFREEDSKYITTFTSGPEHQGYGGIVHGGIISTILDEVMARYIYAKGLNGVTARLDVRFRQPTPVGQVLTAISHITGQRGHLYELTGEIRLADGTLTAEAKATVAVVKDVKV